MDDHPSLSDHPGHQRERRLQLLIGRLPARMQSAVRWLR